MAACLTPCSVRSSSMWPLDRAISCLPALHPRADAMGTSFDAALGRELQRINAFFLEQERRAEVRPGMKSYLTGLAHGSCAAGSRQAPSILSASSRSRTEAKGSG